MLTSLIWDNRGKEKQSSTNELIVKFSKAMLVICLVITIAVIAFFGLIFSAISNYGEAQIDKCDRETYAAIADVALPPSADNFVATCGRFMSSFGDGMFTIHPDDFDRFLETTAIETPLISEIPSDTNSRYFSNMSGRKDSVLYGFRQYSMGYAELIVDTSNPEQWVVYYVAGAGG